MPPLLKLHISRGKPAHGYLLIGPLDSARIAAREASALLVGQKDDEDFHGGFYDISGKPFGISDARYIITEANLRSFSGLPKIFFADIDNITSEAANALLKIVEEPPANNYFFFRVSAGAAVPPTLKSRLVALRLADGSREDLLSFFTDFQKQILAKKMNIIEKIAEDKEKQAMFLDACETHFDRILRDSIRADDFRGAAAAQNSLEALVNARRFLGRRVAYAKPVLEYLVISAC